MKEKFDIKRLPIKFVKLFGLTFLIFHFVLTFIYVMPVTPVKLQHQQLLNGYIGTLFPQNWSLFAPNPISRNESLIVMCVKNEEPTLTSMDSLPSTNWEDITLPLWQGVQRNRFTAYDRLARIQGGVIRQYYGALPELDYWRQSCEKGSESSCKFLEEKVNLIKKNAEERLAKIGSSYCKEAYGAGAVKQVAIRIRGDQPVPWSKRYTQTGTTIQDNNVGIYPMDETVLTAGVYKSKRR